MSVQNFIRSTTFERPVRDVFAWHERAGALERLTPPWEKVELLKVRGGIHNGARVVLRSKAGPVWWRWEVVHSGYDEARSFCDVQKSGPFSLWEHEHIFKYESPAVCTMTDSIRYKLPGGPLGGLGNGWVRRRLERMFAYRHEVLGQDLEMAARYGAVRNLRVLVAGASGLVGSALVPFLRSQGHEVMRLVRKKPQHADELFWNPVTGDLDLTHQRPFDVVIQLAGANVGEGRWTASRREAIRSSRVLGTRTLVQAMDRLRHRPFTFLVASAVGYYGESGDHELYEGDCRGDGFLSGICEAWEKEAAVARGYGIRVAKLRFGTILSPAGGALARLLPVFSAGLGGKLGTGDQWMSWISIDDALGAIYHAILDQRCSGPMNVVAPEPVTNREFTTVLARVLNRPAAVSVPAAVLRTLYGAMADELLLASQRAIPGRLEETRYAFRYPELEGALRHVLGRPA